MVLFKSQIMVLITACSIFCGNTQAAPIVIADFDGGDDPVLYHMVQEASESGSLRAVTTDFDPYLYWWDVSALNIGTATYGALHFDMEIDEGGGDTQVFYGTSVAPGFAGPRLVTFPAPEGRVNYHLLMSGAPDWSGTLRDVRIDPFHDGVGRGITLYQVAAEDFGVPGANTVIDPYLDLGDAAFDLREDEQRNVYTGPVSLSRTTHVKARLYKTNNTWR